MTATWKEHCPHDGEEQPARRQAWRKGWFYRMDHGPANPPKAIKLKMFERGLLAFWLRGYSAADEHLEEARPVVRR